MMMMLIPSVDDADDAAATADPVLLLMILLLLIPCSADADADADDPALLLTETCKAFQQNCLLCCLRTIHNSQFSTIHTGAA